MNAGTGGSSIVAKGAVQANRMAETMTTASAAARSPLEAGKVERKMLRSLPVGTQYLLQTGKARTQWITSNAHNGQSAGVEYPDHYEHRPEGLGVRQIWSRGR